jgi:SAM-dependent methyltransferase
MKATKGEIKTTYEGAALAKRAAFMAEQVKNRAWNQQNGQPAVLDLGCGLGTIPFLLGSLGYQVIGVDLDTDTIADCQQRNQSPNVTFIVGNAETLHLKQKFDVVIASEVIEHVPYPDLVVKTMAEHLAEGGIGIISIPNGYCLWELVVSRFLQKGRLVSWLYKSPKLHKALTGGDTPFYSKNVFCFHSHFFSFGRLKKLLADNGFKIALVRHSDLGILPEWSWLRFLKSIECRLANYVPHFLAGGWLLRISKEEL